MRTLKKTFLHRALLFSLVLHASPAPSHNVDLTIVGHINFADGIGKIAYGIIDCLHKDLIINHIPTSAYTAPALKEMPPAIKKIATAPSNEIGKVILLTHLVNSHTYIPANKSLMIAYSMFETTRIPDAWVSTLNEKFDAVVVPDPWLINVYENSGVTIPIFCLPIGIYIDELLTVPMKKGPHNPFVFGNLAALSVHKNPLLIVEAFIKAFGNSPRVRLVLNARNKNLALARTIIATIKKAGVKNITFKNHALSWDNYVELMKSFDCYVAISKGEGFSIPPREAMALRIPVIVSDNSAQHTICESGYVRCVNAIQPEPAQHRQCPHDECGDFYVSSVDDLAQAMKDVYYHDKFYREKAKRGREWVQQYQYKNLHKKYLNLVKPRQVILGDRNSITDDYLMTNSPALYQKYLQLGALPYA